MAYVVKPCRGCGGPKDSVGRGICYCTACRHKLAFPPVRPPRERSLADVERQAKMVELYQRGSTLQEIGALYGITRERVRQIIAAAGLTRESGGQSKRSRDRARLKALRRQAKRDRECYAIYGCSHSEVLLLNGGHPVSRQGKPARMYFHQRRNAGFRSIEWQMTLVEWIQVWKDSGHFDERGRTADAYVMARKGDTGPYAVGNVYITTLADNVRDYRKALKRRGVVCPDGYVRLPERAAEMEAA